MAREGMPESTGRTENFFTRNIRVITFALCVLLFFGAAWAIGSAVYGKREANREGAVITRADVLALAGKKQYVTLSDFRRFKGDEQKKSVTVTERVGDTVVEHEKSAGVYYYIDVEEEFLLLGVFDPNGTVIYCTLTHLSTGRQADLLTDDVNTFFKQFE